MGEEEEPGVALFRGDTGRAENRRLHGEGQQALPETHGWAFGQFAYDPATQTFKPAAPLSATGHECGYACHTTVANHDYVFTAYPKR